MRSVSSSSVFRHQANRIGLCNVSILTFAHIGGSPGRGFQTLLACKGSHGCFGPSFVLDFLFAIGPKKAH